jgi:hypothetical protein
MSAQLPAQQFRCPANVFLAIGQASLATMEMPAPVADVACNLSFVDGFPAFNPIGAAGRGQVFWSSLVPAAFVVGRPQHVTGRQEGSVGVKNMLGEFPPERQKDGQLRPRAIGAEQSILSDVERRRRASPECAKALINAKMRAKYYEKKQSGNPPKKQTKKRSKSR